MDLSKRLIITGSLLAIIGSCNSESVKDCYQGVCHATKVKNVCLTDELKACLDTYVSDCGTDYECVSLCQKRCDKYLPDGCEFTTFGSQKK